METVIIEYLDLTKVSILPYDMETREVTAEILKVVSVKQAYNNYEVVGEIKNGELRLFGEEEEEDYSDFEDFDEDD